MTSDDSSEAARPIVLVVDDEASLRSMLERSLRLHGCVPLVAVSIREAIGIANAANVDAFIVDLNLARGHSGVDILRWLRGHPKYHHSPLFVLTGQLDIPADQLQEIHGYEARIFYKGGSVQELIGELTREIQARRDAS
jgi:DNA-binding response OmpR family regulator